MVPTMRPLQAREESREADGIPGMCRYSQSVAAASDLATAGLRGGTHLAQHLVAVAAALLWLAIVCGPSSGPNTMTSYIPTCATAPEIGPAVRRDALGNHVSRSKSAVRWILIGMGGSGTGVHGAARSGGQRGNPRRVPLRVSREECQGGERCGATWQPVAVVTGDPGTGAHGARDG